MVKSWGMCRQAVTWTIWQKRNRNISGMKNFFIIFWSLVLGFLLIFAPYYSLFVCAFWNNLFFFNYSIILEKKVMDKVWRSFWAHRFYLWLAIADSETVFPPYIPLLHFVVIWGWPWDRNSLLGTKGGNSWHDPSTRYEVSGLRFEPKRVLVLNRSTLLTRLLNVLG